MKQLILLCLFSLSALADTRYITDQLSINLRAGQGLKYKITRRIPSGTAVELIETYSKTGYSKIRLADGKTGYVLTRYLLDQPVARDRIAEMEKRIRELESSPEELSSRFAQLSREHQALQEAYQNLKIEKNLLEKELQNIREASANAVRIAEERRTLQKQLAQMSKRTAEQDQQIQELKNKQQQHWFLIGAGVLLGGIVLGLLLPNLRLRRRYDSWGSL